MNEINWTLPINADDPQPPGSHTFPSWFTQQDPFACSEKDRVLMLNHFMEHLDEVMKVAVGKYRKNGKTYLTSDESMRCQQEVAKDFRIQSEINKWLHSWNWGATTFMYGHNMYNMFTRERTQPWLVAAIKAHPSTLFNIQLVYILDCEYSRSPFVEKDNRPFLEKTGYGNPCPLTAPPGDILRHYLEHWENKTNEKGLVDCWQVLEMLNPCSREKGFQATDETRHALFRGFQQHRKALNIIEPAYALPPMFLEDTSKP